MGDFSDERKAIESRFTTQWANRTPVKYENVRSAPMTGEHVALYILTGAGGQVSVGSTPLHRFAGYIVVQVAVKEQTGTDAARQHAETAAGIFRNAEFSSGGSGLIRCRTPHIQPIGVQDGWFLMNVNVPYIRDKTY